MEETLFLDKLMGNVKRYYFFFLKIFSIYFLCVVIRYFSWIFLFDTFPIPTNSMQPTIIPGDVILVEKLSLGARLYHKIDSTIGGHNPPTTRVGGFGGIKRNDIIVFNFPVPYDWGKIEFNIRLVYCKRCVALPGDTISIVDGFYRNSATQDTLGYIPAQKELSISRRSTDGIARSLPSDTINYDWTIKNFGPLYVPAKGATIDLDTINYILYKLPIEYETGKTIIVKNGLLLLDNKPITGHTFIENYYFTAGDNVFDSQDSRYWGFVPEKHIVGVATRIFYFKSRTTGKYRWDRFMKSI